MARSRSTGCPTSSRTPSAPTCPPPRRPLRPPIPARDPAGTDPAGTRILQARILQARILQARILQARIPKTQTPEQAPGPPRGHAGVLGRAVPVHPGRHRRAGRRPLGGHGARLGRRGRGERLRAGHLRRRRRPGPGRPVRRLQLRRARAPARPADARPRTCATAAHRCRTRSPRRRHAKGSWLVELDAGGAVRVEANTRPGLPRAERPARTLADLLTFAAYERYDRPLPGRHADRPAGRGRDRKSCGSGSRTCWCWPSSPTAARRITAATAPRSPGATT